MVTAALGVQDKFISNPTNKYAGLKYFLREDFFMAQEKNNKPIEKKRPGKLRSVWSWLTFSCLSVIVLILQFVLISKT